jgi:hypothetical protein
VRKLSQNSPPHDLPMGVRYRNKASNIQTDGLRTQRIQSAFRGRSHESGCPKTHLKISALLAAVREQIVAEGVNG